MYKNITTTVVRDTVNVLLWQICAEQVRYLSSSSDSYDIVAGIVD